jgi:hypothetical protein
MQEKSHKWVYITIAVVIVALMVAGVLLYHQEKQSKASAAAAKEFVHALQVQGLPSPTVEEAARMFGTDGGPYAKNLEQELQHAQYVWQLGTAGPASRPVILDGDFLKAARAFVMVYAPEKMAQFQQWVDGLKTGETQ